jgi:hypothetical protein
LNKFRGVRKPHTFLYRAELASLLGPSKFTEFANRHDYTSLPAPVKIDMFVANQYQQ